jgi:hypothetical protein
MSHWHRQSLTTQAPQARRVPQMLITDPRSTAAPTTRPTCMDETMRMRDCSPGHKQRGLIWVQTDVCALRLIIGYSLLPSVSNAAIVFRAACFHLWVAIRVYTICGAQQCRRCAEAWAHGVVVARWACGRPWVQSPVCPLLGVMYIPCGWPRGCNKQKRFGYAWASRGSMVCDSRTACEVIAQSVNRGICKMSVGDLVVAFFRLRAPSQPVERHGLHFHNTRCVDAPLAPWLERWSYEPCVAGLSPAGSKLIACSDHVLPLL